MRRTSTDRCRVLILAILFLLLPGCAISGQARLEAAHTSADTIPADSLQSQSVPMAQPTRLSIADLGIDTKVLPMPAGACPVLDPPTLADAYWVGCRSEPGTDSDGTVFVIGHAGAGTAAVFDTLPDIVAGSRVLIETDSGTLEYTVRSTALYEKFGEAQESPELRLRQPGRLVLVTCYLENGTTLSSKNFVAYAEITGALAR
ncbi:sortase family protein [Rhodococcus globerulus]|nr:sortase family protein [Rhodococcus globerulus]